MPLEIYPMLIRSLRRADERTELLKRFVAQMEQQWGDFRDRANSVLDLSDPTVCPVDALQHLRWNVGITKELDSLVEGLSTTELRKIIALFPEMVKVKATPTGIKSAITALTGVTPLILDWFYLRWLVGETGIFIEAAGLDSELIGGAFPDLGEYVSNIRIVDDGTLDHQLVRELVDLNRPLSETYEISYVDFLDLFDQGRDRWNTLNGTAAIITAAEKFSVPVDNRESIEFAGSAAWTDYTFKAVIQAGIDKEFGLGVYYTPGIDAAYIFTIDTTNDVTRITHREAAVDVILDTQAWLDLSPTTDYGIQIRVQPLGANTHIRVWIDGVLQHDIVHSGPETILTQGTAVIDSRFTASGAGSALVDNVELFEHPLTTETVAPAALVP